jgi:RNA polymerase sigma factor (sigma-70 family)
MGDRAERIAWFKATILPHEPSLRRHLGRLVGRQEAEDLVSEVLTRAYATSDWGRITAGKGYIFTIARNLVFDSVRRRKVVTFETYADLDVLQVTDGMASPEVLTTARDELRVLRRAVDEMSPRCREVFLLRRVEELSIAEVGDRLGLSVKTIERHMTKALAHLARCLAQSEVVNHEEPVATWRTGTRTS